MSDLCLALWLCAGSVAWIWVMPTRRSDAIAWWLLLVPFLAFGMMSLLIVWMTASDEDEGDVAG